MKKSFAAAIILTALILAGCQEPGNSTTSQEPSKNAENSSKVAITINPSEESSAWTVEEGSPEAEDPTSINIYLVSLGDKGASGPLIGCDDSLVGTKVKFAPTRDAQTAKDALVKLFAVKDQYYGSSGLYNALYNSNLKVDSLTADKDKKATLKLSGTYTLGGVCDNPRFEEQIRGTVLQFKELYSDVEIFINDKPLKELLSGK